MRLLSARDHKRMPWKNSAGVTTEIAISPPGAAIDDFDWRISMASVPASGPFSRFAGIDRVLAVLGGAMTLTVNAGEPVFIDAASPPIAFAGDAATHADVESAVTDLNVMVRRGRFQARVTRLDGSTLDARSAATFVLLRSTVDIAGWETLGMDDVFHLEQGDHLKFLYQPENAWLIEIDPR